MSDLWKAAMEKWAGPGNRPTVCLLFSNVPYCIHAPLLLHFSTYDEAFCLSHELCKCKLPYLFTSN